VGRGIRRQGGTGREGLVVNARISRRTALAAPTVALLAAARGSQSVKAIQAEQVPGKIAFVRNGNIWVWSGGSASEVLTGGNIADPRWSPDGNELLYIRFENSYSDLFTYELDTGSETQLTFNQPFDEVGSYEYATNSSWVLDPDWARSGLIGFVSDMVGSGGYLSLWLMASTSEQPYLALQAVAEDDLSGLCLAPHDSLAAYTVRVRMGDGRFETYVALRDLDTGETFPVAESSGDIFDPAINPDATWIAVTIRAEDNVTDIWLTERSTGERRRGTRDQNAMAPRWSDDGNWFAYYRMQDYGFEIWVGQFSRGRIRNPFKIYDEDGLDPQSGVSWWMPSGASPATADD
jgi:Tol biopolymer transport system component